MTGLARSALRLIPDEYDQVMRLTRFRAGHPGVVIVAGDGWWQGRIPEASGEIIVTRYTLRELLDTLDSLVSCQPDGSA